MPSNLANRIRLVLLAAPAVVSVTTVAQAQPLPPVPVPPENPITEPKRVLGKILFWDEQMSVDGTMACATCHSFARGGIDPRRARNPGPDGLTNTADDIFGSPGVIRSDSFKDFVRDVTFGTNRQITGRNSMSPINAAYSPSLFWDGRARSQFVDPETGLVSITAGGALESQAAGPIVNSVEMAHDGVQWPGVTTRLASVRPLALATNFPADVSGALAGGVTYPQLFQAAFGDTSITADRIAKAIATYQRTLIANQTPFDLGTLTPNQQLGLQIMGQANRNCTQCHTPPLFTDNQFHNIGLRPPGEDPGLRLVTGLASDRGKMKTPSLRNVGLRTQFMHNGVLTTIQQVFGFYDRAPGTTQFQDNIDPLMATTRIPPGDGGPVQDFIANGLRDPRVANETFPFDRPTLFTQRPADVPNVIAGSGRAGSGGIVPQIIAIGPPMIGNADLRIGLDRALGGATARLAISFSPPVLGRITPAQVFETKTAAGAGNGAGLATYHWNLVGAGLAPGQLLFAQWIVDDPGAAEGQALSTVASLRLFCGSSGCPTICAVDYNADGAQTVADIFAFLPLWFAADPRADFDRNTVIAVQDVFAFLTAWFAGC